MAETADRVSDVVRRHIRPASGQDDADDNSLELDSITLIGVINGLESEFGIELPAELISKHNFSSVAAIVALIQGRLAARAEDR